VSADVERIAALALAEDGETDITTAVTIPAGLARRARRAALRRRLHGPSPPPRSMAPRPIS
jgi:hypothetical protein